MLRLNPTRGLFTWLTWTTARIFVRRWPVKQDPGSNFNKISIFLQELTHTTCHTGVPTVLPQLYIEKSFHTLFSEWTKMFFAPISLKSLSASYFRSFDTLNLKIRKAFTLSYSRSSKTSWQTVSQKTGYTELKYTDTAVSALRNSHTLTRLLFFCLTSNFHRWSQLWSFLFLHQHHHLSRIQLCLHWEGMFHVAVGQRTKICIHSPEYITANRHQQTSLRSILLDETSKPPSQTAWRGVPI